MHHPQSPGIPVSETSRDRDARPPALPPLVPPLYAYFAAAVRVPAGEYPAATRTTSLLNSLTLSNLYPFEGVIQHYAWGGFEYLPRLLHRPHTDQEPWAELWMGAHAKGPGKVTDSPLTLDQLIDRDPDSMLGKQVARRFEDRLPFLFKILDVREMLSIQVHPTKAAAEAGFAREEQNGPARDAPDRNYRDDNHKPELGVALTDFYLLHGFHSESVIGDTLSRVPGWQGLSANLKEKGVEGLYAHVMYADQSAIDELLQPLADHLSGQSFTRDQPEFWAQRAVEQYTTNGHHDRGMFSIFWFNLVHLRPGEGIFQDAGIPHAYLEGVCIELMANSDNVLRGGLTPKHIDVPELLEKTRFDAVTPAILSVTSSESGWSHYATPAPDFELSVARTESGSSVSVDTASGPAILLLLDGSARGDALRLDQEHRTVFVPAGQRLELATTPGTTVYLATVGG